VRRVERWVVRLLAEVELCDVLPVFPGRHPERDGAAEPARPRDRLVEDRGPVGRAHEEQVVSGWAELRDAQRDTSAVEANLPGDEDAVEREVDHAAERLLEESRVVDAVNLDQQHVQAEREAAEHSTETAHPATTAHATAGLPEGVELVDEDEAATPALGLLLGRADHRPHRDHVHADEHSVEGGTG